jgi:hypothetical protein
VEIKNRQQVLLISTVALLALLVLNWLVVSPLIDSWKARSERISDLKKRITQGSVLVDREDVIRGHWEEMRTNTLPATTSLAAEEFYKTFSRCAKDGGINVVSYRPQWKQNGDDNASYMTYECSVDATGNLDTMARFIYEIEKEPMAMKIDNLEIITHDNNGQQLSLNLQISGLQLVPKATP